MQNATCSINKIKAIPYPGFLYSALEKSL